MTACVEYAARGELLRNIQYASNDQLEVDRMATKVLLNLYSVMFGELLNDGRTI